MKKIILFSVLGIIITCAAALTGSYHLDKPSASSSSVVSTTRKSTTIVDEFPSNGQDLIVDFDAEKENQQDYVNGWHDIGSATTSLYPKLFSPDYDVKEINPRSKSKYYSFEEKNSEYLRYEDSEFGDFEWRNLRALEVAINNHKEIIQTEEKLKKIFAPVDSEIEALGFFLALRSNHKKLALGFHGLKAKTKTIEDGYLIKIYGYDNPGSVYIDDCKEYGYSESIFKVSKDGNTKLESEKKLSSDRKGCLHRVL